MVLTVGRLRLGRIRVLVGAVMSAAMGLAGGSAWAFITGGSGSGSGTTSVGTIQQVTVVAASGSPTSTLFPGGSADLRLTIDNPNSYSLEIVGVAQNGPVTVVGGSGCTSDTGTWPGITAGNSGVSVPTATGISGVTFGPGNGVNADIPGGAAMAISSASGCQGASFEVPVKITVQKG
jgi:hypothetical protein